MHVGYVFKECGAGLFVELEGSAAVTQDRLGKDDPRVVVTEYARVLLVSGRIGRYLAKFRSVSCVRRIQQYKTVIGIKTLIHRSESFFRISVVRSYAGHHAHALRFYIYLPFIAFLRSDFFPEGVICS